MTECYQPNQLNHQGFLSPCVSDPSRQSGNHEWQGVLLTMIFIGCCCCCCAAGDTKVENIANCCCSPCVLIGNCCKMLTNLCKSLGKKVCNTFGSESEPSPRIAEADLVLHTGLPGPLQMQDSVVGRPFAVAALVHQPSPHNPEADVVPPARLPAPLQMLASAGDVPRGVVVPDVLV